MNPGGDPDAFHFFARVDAVAPSVKPPRLGEPVADGLLFAKRLTAILQANEWNRRLRDDPVCGPSCGLIVGVGSEVGGHYPLVWVQPVQTA